jgi:N-acetylmuramoyl-L-alanine amidase
MKKLIAVTTLALSLLISSPVFAYEVKQGDTMNKIAKESGISLQELSKANPQIKNVNLIFIGETVNTEAVQTTGSIETPVTSSTTIDHSSEQISATSSEKDLLARLVRAESEMESYAGKVAVAVVVLNRVDSDQFPNTIQSVINQPGQFSPVGNGSINQKADDESIRAVAEALTSDRSFGAGSLFFYNPRTATSRWLDSKTTTLVIGNHVFKK